MRKLPNSEKLAIAGPAGALQALLEMPREGVQSGIAVICHPHPVHGGTMDNKVVHTLSRAFNHSGFAALRFNFRGTGDSAGVFDDGAGERQDTLAAIRWMEGRFPSLPLWLGGFSFGAAMAIHASLQSECAGLVSIAPAVSRFASEIEEQPACPWLIVQGDQDELVDIDETVAWMDDLDPGPELVVFPETGHFFHGKLVPLRETVEAFVANHSGRGQLDP